MASVGTRSTAAQRRREVVAAACIEFGDRGLDGTSTEAVAKRAGISQPYLFRLFPTKKALFVAAVEATFGIVSQAFATAAQGRLGDDAVAALGECYDELLRTDPVVLRVQLHAYAASSQDDEVRRATTAAYLRLWNEVVVLTGMTDEQTRLFFAHGMLCNVIAALALDPDGSDPLACRLAGKPGAPAYLEALLHP
jgi:AcrR family transcriptional regulator